MTRLLAEDLLLLCWDHDRGRVATTCSGTIGAAVGGALLLDAVLAGALDLDGDRVAIGGTVADDPLLARAVTSVADRRRAPKASSAVSRLGTSRLVRDVRDRLVDSGALRREPRRILGIFPADRYRISDEVGAAETAERTRALLLGMVDDDDVTVHDAALAALSAPARALDRLVDRRDRKAARRRAEGFAQGRGLPKAVADVIEQANAAAMTAIMAATAASSSSTSSSN